MQEVGPIARVRITGAGRWCSPSAGDDAHHMVIFKYSTGCPPALRTPPETAFSSASLSWRGSRHASQLCIVVLLLSVGSFAPVIIFSIQAARTISVADDA